jgi:hypothetical protein
LRFDAAVDEGTRAIIRAASHTELKRHRWRPNNAIKRCLT